MYDNVIVCERVYGAAHIHVKRYSRRIFGAFDLVKQSSFDDLARIRDRAERGHSVCAQDANGGEDISGGISLGQFKAWCAPAPTYAVVPNVCRLIKKPIQYGHAN